MTKTFVRPLLAATLACTLAVSLALLTYAQEPQPPALPPPTTNPVPNLSLGVAKYNYTKAPKPFPNLLAPYKPISVEAVGLTNSPRIDQMIQDGKLNLSLQDAVELALQNNLDIIVQRYNPWLADTSILKTAAGGFGGGTPGAAFAGSTASTPILNFDPTLTSTFSVYDRNIPVNNPLTSGTCTGVSSLARLTLHTSTFNTQLSEGFHTGTTFFTAWANTRSSSTPPANLFNPSDQSTIFVGFSQQLLNGFG